MTVKIRCRHCGEHVEGELAQIDSALSAASKATGDTRVVYTAVGRNLIEALAEGLRVRRIALEHAEGDMVRSAGEAKR